MVGVCLTVSAAHEWRHIDVVVIAANAQGSTVGVQRHTDGVDRLKQRRGELAGLRRLYSVGAGFFPGSAADDGLAAGSAGNEAPRAHGEPHLGTQRAAHTASA